jgi:LacI family transcriptional regulator
MQPTEDPNPDHQKVRITGTRELLDGRVDGAVVLSVRAIPEEELSVLRKASLPVVLLSVHRKVPGFSQVLSGTYERTRLAAEKLLDLGHRKIGFLGYYVDSLQDEVAKEALQDLFRERGLKLPEDWMEASDHWNLWDVARIERQLDKFLDKKFTAVICVSADQASLGIEILRKKRIQVPRDLSLVAFGPLSFVAQFQKPALCLLEADIRGAGAKAYELFKQAKEGQEPQSLCIDWKWAENGESAGPPPK